jgi:hypothetical protein
VAKVRTSNQDRTISLKAAVRSCINNSVIFSFPFWHYRFHISHSVSETSTLNTRFISVNMQQRQNCLEEILKHLENKCHNNHILC